MKGTYSQVRAFLLLENMKYFIAPILLVFLGCLSMKQEAGSSIWRLAEEKKTEDTKVKGGL
jgi:hypothetical protein